LKQEDGSNSALFIFLRKYVKMNKVMKNIIEKVEDLQAKLLHLEDCL